MPVIRIDDEVMDELKRMAIEEGYVFGSPNDVLRKVLKLETVDRAAHPFRCPTSLRSKPPTSRLVPQGPADCSAERSSANMRHDSRESPVRMPTKTGKFYNFEDHWHSQ